MWMWAFGVDGDGEEKNVVLDGGGLEESRWDDDNRDARMRMDGSEWQRRIRSDLRREWRNGDAMGFESAGVYYIYR